MQKEIVFRPYQAGDEEGIVKLLDLVFDGWPNFDLSCSPLDHWRWKYRGGPVKADDIIVCLNEGGIIGCKHSIPLNIKVGDEILFGTIGSDLTVHPDFRNLGISKKIRDMNRELKEKMGYKFSYFVTSNPILIKSYSESRPPFPHKITNYVRIRDINLQMRMMPVPNPLLMKLAFRALKTSNDLRNALKKHYRSGMAANVSMIGGFDDRADEFWERVSTRYNFIVERRRDYLNWRYCHPHAGDFIVRQAENDGQIVGYSVLLTNKRLNNYPIGYIVDLLTAPDNLSVADVLVADAVKRFDVQGVNIINTLAVEGHPHERVLKKYGFLDSRIDLKVFLASYVTEEALKRLKASPPQSIHFSYGDIDSLPSSAPKYA